MKCLAGLALRALPLDRPAYPSDVSDEEWALVAPHLALLREDSAQRDHDLRAVFSLRTAGRDQLLAAGLVGVDFGSALETLALPTPEKADAPYGTGYSLRNPRVIVRYLPNRNGQIDPTIS